jgi:hypothetical protein
MKIILNNKEKDLKPIKNFNLEGFEYPFEVMFWDNRVKNKETKKYETVPGFPSDYLRNIPGEKECGIGDFPKNIKRCYFIQEGENDGIPWNLLCYLDNGVYVYMSAWCDYTGFDCQGEIILWSSKKIQTLIDMALSNEDRHSLMKIVK